MHDTAPAASCTCPTSTVKRKRSPRLPTLSQAESLARTHWVNPTEDGLHKARRTLVRWMWRARRAGQHELRASLRRVYDRIRTQQQHRDWEIDDTERRTRQRNRRDDVQHRRETRQRQQAESSPARQQLQTQQRQRDLDRFRANALAQALWALHQGHRDWTPLPPASSTSSTRPPPDEPVQRPVGAAYLDVQVPWSAYGPGCTLRIWRHDYEELLNLWGYHRVARANRLRDKLGGGGVRSDLDALHALAIESAKHPNLALSWNGYVTSNRLGDVYTHHQASRSMQLASGRSGDLREALREVYAQAQVLDT